MIERIFLLSENDTTVRRELIAGFTTFVTMSYIIFVQPGVMKESGMDFGAVLVATCISSALATFLMAFLANYPIALAPAMGHNFFFTYTVCGAVALGGLGYPWQIALGSIFISGTIFIILSLFGIRERIMEIIPESLRSAIAVGIGLLIAMVGFQWSGLIVDSPGTLVMLGDLKSLPVILAVIGFVVIIVLHVLGTRGAILIGIGITTILGLAFGLLNFMGILGLPPSISPTLFKLDIKGVFSQPDFLTVIFIFLFLDLFDTVGTLIGVTKQAGLMKNGKLPRARGALLSDAIGTVAGASLGTSTITSYIESAAGVAAGGRTGLANLVTGSLFILSLFFYPLVKTVGQEYITAGGAKLYPAIAPALIFVGSIMMRNVKDINWESSLDAIPAFLTIIIMPITFSITEGIAFGFILSSLLFIVKGRMREINWMVHAISILFILRYIFLRV
ncbi:MAG: NCS2 family permease [Fidelibacterota bacterium]